LSVCIFKAAEKEKLWNPQIQYEKAKSLALSDHGLYYNQDKWLFKNTSPANEATEQLHQVLVAQKYC